MEIGRFVERWVNSAAAERSHKDMFLNELCEILGVERPNPITDDPHGNTYVFEKDVPTRHEDRGDTVRKIDLYKRKHFILEAKQGTSSGKRKSFGKRGTPQWHAAMDKAKGQAIGYADSLGDRPPFIIVCDIGHCFDLYSNFDGARYVDFPNAQRKRIYFRSLQTDPAHLETLRRVWTNPIDLDPTRHAARVTTAVAGSIAKLSRSLEDKGHSPELVARFLMRCLFTMFAEDVGLLPPRTFTDLIKNSWLNKPSTFVGPGGVSSLWKAMNNGADDAPMLGKILRFNGGLFADTTAIPLTQADLKLLLDAAEYDWSDVEPAIFGTLLERALLPKERHMLGAHFTPRAYVERLVRPTIEEPLRAEWENVKAEVRQVVLAAGPEPERPNLNVAEMRALEDAALQQAKERSAQRKGTSKPTAQLTLDHADLAPAASKKRTTSPIKKAQRAAMEAYLKQLASREDKLEEARDTLLAFLRRLASLRVLDPACGSGNFLYVALDVFKRLESEVLAALEGVGITQQMLATQHVRVTPGQFLGIEVKRWAKEIAELVLWIGYLQWHYRTHGRGMAPPEPVLQDFQNVECRDAVLAWDRIEPLLDDAGKAVTRWDGETKKKSPVSGEMVPDETAREPVFRYVNPRKADWPKADFIIGNPPFLGKLYMLGELGEGYVEALRKAHHGELPDGIDFVFYWWAKASELARRGSVIRFGFVSTNSITQPFNRRVVATALASDPPIRIVYAIPDHPWVDTAKCADVRIAMTVGEAGSGEGTLARVVKERAQADGVVDVDLVTTLGQIREDLRIGANVAGARLLASNTKLAGTGLLPGNRGFVIDEATAHKLKRDVAHQHALIHPFRNGRDVMGRARGMWIIDTYGWSEDALMQEAPSVYQWLHSSVYAERQVNRDPRLRRQWWLFRRTNEQIRRALRGLGRYIATSETARRRIFVFLPSDVRPEHKLVVIASDDAYVLGVLSSRIHVTWALAAGGRLGVGNDPVYVKTACFEKFPFPDAASKHVERIRAIGERIEAHRQKRLEAAPDLMLTDVYAVLTKVSEGLELSPEERQAYEHGLISVLKGLHDELDAAVFDAYGWPDDLTDEQVLERLVALNAERAGEERRGIVRWLRPEFQDPAVLKVSAQQPVAEDGGEEPADATVAKAEARPWPKKLAERIAAVRDHVAGVGRAVSTNDVAGSFKGARRSDVEEVLESLAAVGVLIELGGGRWRPVSRA